MDRALRRAASKRRRGRRMAPADRMSGILETARDVFCRKGYDHALVSEIAAKHGVVEGTVFKYFPTKRDLLLKVLERWYGEMFGDYARHLAGVTAPRERLRVLVRAHLRSVRDNPQLCRLMFREVRSGPDYPGSRVHALNRRYTRLLMDVIDEGRKAGAFRCDVPLPLLRDLVYGGIEHHTWNFMSGRGALDVDQVADNITAVLCDGIQRHRRRA